MFLPSGIFIAACFVYAAYSYYSIKARTGWWEWHVCQLFAAGLFVFAGYALGNMENITWHIWGEIAAAAILGVPAYVFFLHYLLKKR